MGDCNICCEPYKGKARKQIVCNHCGFGSCATCTKTYILDSLNDARCMSPGCKKVWSREFLIESFSYTFVDKTYKKHKESLLYDRQLSMMEETQAIIEERADAKKINDKILEIDKQIRELRNKKTELVNERYHLIYKESTVKNSAAKYFGHCPESECKGFINASGKCGICEIKVCKTCKDKLTDIEVEDIDMHTCDPNTVESIRQIKKDCRNCPKCKISIQRIEGCFEKGTEMLLYDQSLKNVEDIKVGDNLIGIDGDKREVLKVCNGIDELYKIKQSNGMDYTVNSKHTLILMDQDNKVFEYTVDNYLKLPQSTKNRLYGFKSENGVNYQEQKIELDPYLLGLWLGDGTHTSPELASNDSEIQLFLLDWCNNNNAELVHEEGVKFRIRRKGLSNGKEGLRFPVGQGMSEECKGCNCKTGNKMEICDYIDQEYLEEKSESRTNPFMDQLRTYNLVGNKHIPQEYLNNSRKIRLQLLAGLIDSDGCVSCKGKRVSITQVKPNLSEQIISLARSLGYVVNVTIRERRNESIFGQKPKDYKDQYQINISSSKLSEIPTKLWRKKCENSNTNKNLFKSTIKVEPIGKGEYFGFMVENDNILLGKDHTILKNCRQMWCTQCHTAFDWKTGEIVIGMIHNPHFSEWQRNNGGAGERVEAVDPCNVDRAYNIQYYSVSKALEKCDKKDYVKLNDLFRFIRHVKYYDMTDMNRTLNSNKDLDYRIDFMTNKIDLKTFQRKLQALDKKQTKQREVYMVYDMFTNTIINSFVTYVFNGDIPSARYNERGKVVHADVKKIGEFNKILNKLIDYTNESLTKIGKKYKNQVPLIVTESGMRETRTGKVYHYTYRTKSTKC